MPVLEAVRGFWDHGCVTHGAALAFYALFVLVPIPIFVVAGAAVLVGDDLARAEVVSVLRSLTSDQMAVTLGQVLESAAEPSGGGGVRLFGLVALGFGATAFFVELHEVLNKIWRVPVEDFRLRDFLRSRLFSFAMVAAAGAVLLVLALAGALTRGFGARLTDWLPLPDAAFGLAGLLATFLLNALLLFLVFRFVPDTTVSLREVWLGSLVTALLILLGNELIGVYLRQTRLASAYGAAGSLVLTLTWIYYSMLAFLFGGELTRALGGGTVAAPKPPARAAAGGRGDA